MKTVGLHIHPKFRVIGGKFMSANKEEIFGAFVTVTGICCCVYGNLKSDPFLGHLYLDQSMTLYFKIFSNISCIYS
jgi:hypothetical protein